MGDINNKSIWPEWEIVGVLGHGSFGKVYKARREELGTAFFSAIKVITVPQDENEVAAARADGMNNDSTRAFFKSFVDDWVNEIKLLESLKGNQNIVSIEDYKVVEHEDKIGWDIYIRMELLKSFTDHIGDSVLNEDEIIQLGIDMCSALELCAKLNIVHRDIKPENIFISKFGSFKLGDFGVARQLERTGSELSKKGTYHYMAPEVYNGKPYNNSVDTYSLGIVMYKLINDNRTPFLPAAPQQITFQNKEEALVRRLKGDKIPFPARASNEFAAVVLNACEYDPSHRYASATEMKNALEDVRTNNNRTYGGTVVQPKKQNHCTNCGSVLKVGATFCQKCGGKVEDTTKPENTGGMLFSSEAELDQTKAVAKAPKSMAAPIYPTENKIESFDTPKKNKKSKLPIVIAAMLIVLIIFGSAGAFVYLKFQDEEAETTQSIETEMETEIETSFYTTVPQTEESITEEVTQALSPEVSSVNYGYPYDKFSTPLGDIKITQSENNLGYQEVIDVVGESVVADTIGNLYFANKDLLALRATRNGSPGYIKFYAGKDNKKLTGLLATAVLSDDMTCEVEIFADDELIYTSTEMRRASEPIAVDLSIENREWITIKVNTIEGRDNFYVLLANFSLSSSKTTKAPESPRPRLLSSGKKTKISDLVTFVKTHNFNKVEPGTSIEDTIGNKYGSTNLYTMAAGNYEDSGYLQLYTGKQISTISGKIAVSDDSDDMTVRIEVYADNVLIYTSETFGRAKVPFDLVIPVAGSTWVTIYLKPVEGRSNFNLIVSDLLLS